MLDGQLSFSLTCTRRAYKGHHLPVLHAAQGVVQHSHRPVGLLAHDIAGQVRPGKLHWLCYVVDGRAAGTCAHPLLAYQLDWLGECCFQCVLAADVRDWSKR